MDNSCESNNEAIFGKQTDQLYSRLKYSAWGTIVVAALMVFIVGPNSNQKLSWIWLFILFAVSFYRWLSAFFYIRLDDSEKSLRNWRSHFNLGAYLAAITWILPMWLFYPGQIEYQVLMIIFLTGVAGGSIAILSFDKRLITIFLCILLVGIDGRLLLSGDVFSYELAAVIFIYFIFLIKGGRDIGDSYYELLILRQDSEEHNLTLLSTTERIARIGYWQWDMQSEQLELSANLAAMYGFEQRHINWDAFINRIHEDDRNMVRMAIDTACETGRESSMEYRMPDRKEDHWAIVNQVIKRIDDSYGHHSILGMVQDISVIKSAEQKIFDMAYFDELTGLANRSHFHQHLNEKIKHARRNRLILAILYIDLDGFKEINDSLGHDKGDLYLIKLSKRLKSQIRDEDFIARLGGDEFCVVLADTSDGAAIAQTAERCLQLKSQTLIIDNQPIIPQMSIGIALYPQDGADVDNLLRASDAAMYSAKRRGKNCYAFYDQQMTEDAILRLELESDLQKALQNNEFKLVYQPKISLADGKVVGVEALIRWYHASRGLVSPDQFIDTAERIGLINEIGEWVLETACNQLQQWKLQEYNLGMAVNVSSSHFSSSNFVDKVLQAKRQFNLNDGDLEIEITESMSRDPTMHIQVCHELHVQGVKVAIDDFGTGYSSLSVIKQLEVDSLKVDRVFIQHLPDDKSSAMMVTAITSLAKGLGLDVVAEGVETLEQALFLKSLGCPHVQGYYFSRPVEAEQIPDIVNESYVLPEA